MLASLSFLCARYPASTGAFVPLHLHKKASETLVILCRIQAEAARNEMKDEITLGATDDQVALVSHPIHFWQREEEFVRGVRFLERAAAGIAP